MNRTVRMAPDVWKSPVWAGCCYYGCYGCDPTCGSQPWAVGSPLPVTCGHQKDSSIELLPLGALSRASPFPVSAVPNDLDKQEQVVHRPPGPVMDQQQRERAQAFT